MDRDTKIKLAREVYGENAKWEGAALERLKRFANLVAEHEREACAKLCDDIDTEYEGEEVLATWCAAAIRARGQ